MLYYISIKFILCLNNTASSRKLIVSVILTILILVVININRKNNIIHYD